MLARAFAAALLVIALVSGRPTLAAGPAVGPDASAGIIVIRAARLIDGRGGEPLAPAMVRIDGDKITAVGSALTVPEGAHTIDLGDSIAKTRPSDRRQVETPVPAPVKAGMHGGLGE